jgi:hypothetical protein
MFGLPILPFTLKMHNKVDIYLKGTFKEVLLTLIERERKTFMKKRLLMKIL